MTDRRRSSKQPFSYNENHLSAMAVSIPRPFAKPRPRNKKAAATAAAVAKIRAKCPSAFSTSQSNEGTEPKDDRTELAELLKKKLEVAQTLANLERQIYAFEGSYLEDSRLNGNVVHGWYSNQFATGYKRSTDKTKKNPIRDVDRVFSNSSVTSIAAVTGKIDGSKKYGNQWRETIILTTTVLRKCNEHLQLKINNEKPLVVFIELLNQIEHKHVII